MHRNTTAAAAVIIVSSLALAACSSNSSSAGTTAAESTTSVEAAAYDPDATVDIQVGLEPTSLDVSTTSGAALEQILIPNVYEGLVDRTAEGEYEPALAEDWEVSDDGLTYTFTLREATFHNGSAVEASDVVWSLNTARAEDSVNPDASRLARVAEVTAVDESSVAVVLSERDINFLDALTTNAGVILDEQADTDLASASNGTGPYTVAQWNQGSTLTLERYDDYWGETAHNAEVVFHFIDDASTAANALSAGEIDIFTTSSADTTPLFEEDDGFTITEGDSTSWMTLGFNASTAPFDDVNVRRAVRMAIDKEGMIEILGGQAIEVGGMSVPSDPWYEDLTDIDAYDPEAARELLDGAGIDTLQVTFRVANTYDTRIGEYIVAQLAEVGIEVTIETMEFSTWLEDVFQGGDYQMTMVLHVDPWMVNNYGNADYYWHYDDATAQELVVEARQSQTMEERDEVMQELVRYVSEQAASDWLYSPTTVVVASADVTGYPVDRIANRLPVSSIEVAAQ